MTTIKGIIDSYISDLAAPPLVKQALAMELKRYCEEKCFEQKQASVAYIEEEYFGDNRTEIISIIMNGHRPKIK